MHSVTNICAMILMSCYETWWHNTHLYVNYITTCSYVMTLSCKLLNKLYLPIIFIGKLVTLNCLKIFWFQRYHFENLYYIKIVKHNGIPSMLKYLITFYHSIIEFTTLFWNPRCISVCVTSIVILAAHFLSQTKVANVHKNNSFVSYC